MLPRLAQRIDTQAHASETWVPVLTDEERERAARAAELARLQDREAFMPRLLHGDVVEQLRALPTPTSIWCASTRHTTWTRRAGTTSAVAGTLQNGRARG